MKTGKRAIKSLTAILCAVLCVVIFCGCGVTGTTLPKGMNPDKALAKAQNIAISLSKGEFEEVAEQVSDEMKAEITADKLSDTLQEEVEKTGEVTKFLSWSARGASDDEAGEYAIFVLVCKCEKGSIAYTICLDKDSKICGLSYETK